MVCYIAAFILFGCIYTQTIKDHIVASVGNYPVLYSDIRKRVKGGEDSCSALQELIIESTMLAQADNDTIQISPTVLMSEVEKRLRIIKQSITSEEEIARYFGVDPLQLREDLKNQMEREMKIQQAESKVVGDVKVSPSDVRRFYESLPDSMIPPVPSYFTLGAIYRIPQVSPEAKELTIEKIKSIRERIEKGEKFEYLASIYSLEGSVIPEPVEIDFTEVSGPIADAVKKTPKGEVSDIVVLPGGVAILKVIDKGERTAKIMSIVLPYYIPSDTIAREIELLKKIRNMILIDSISFEEAVRRFSQDEITRRNSGLIMNPQTGDNRLNVDVLSVIDPYILPYISDMNEGDITPPHNVLMPDGRQAIRIVKMLKKVSSHKANLEQDYDMFKVMLIERKRKEKIREWFRAKTGEYYFTVMEEWRHCLNDLLGF